MNYGERDTTGRQSQGGNDIDDTICVANHKVKQNKLLFTSHWNVLPLIKLSIAMENHGMKNI